MLALQKRALPANFFYQNSLSTTEAVMEISIFEAVLNSGELKNIISKFGHNGIISQSARKRTKVFAAQVMDDIATQVKKDRPFHGQHQ